MRPMERHPTQTEISLQLASSDQMRQLWDLVSPGQNGDVAVHHPSDDAAVTFRRLASGDIEVLVDDPAAPEALRLDILPDSPRVPRAYRITSPDSYDPRVISGDTPSESDAVELQEYLGSLLGTQS